MGLFGRDDRTTPAPAHPQTAPARPAPKPLPQTRSDEVTVIARGTRIEGKLSAGNDVQIEGSLHGAVVGESQVTVAEGAKVEAAVHARAVVVAGGVVGDVSADDRIELKPSAVLRGNITAPRIVIQDGASFEGQVYMQKPERNKAPGEPPRPGSAPDHATPTPDAPATPATPAENGGAAGRPGKGRH
jgi:cytoskeletal protein CcmA (bactofilin family)